MMVEESFPAASLLRRVGAAAMMVAVPLQAARAEELPTYCAALREVTALVQAKERFKSIIGKPREGSFLETTLPLPGWADCSFYGARTYTCDSHPIDTTAEAGRAFERTFGDVKGCLREGWAEDASRASPGYAVVRDDRQVASITINTDRIDTDRYVVRLILFLRSR
jgi:hypothetical protein